MTYLPHALGSNVLVKDIVGDGCHSAVIVGWYDRHANQLDATGRFIIAPKGRVYQVRYQEGMGVYNVHEDLVTA